MGAVHCGRKKKKSHFVQTCLSLQVFWSLFLSLCVDEFVGETNNSLLSVVVVQRGPRHTNFFLSPVSGSV